MSLARRRFLAWLVAQGGLLGGLGCRRPTGDRITIGAMPPGTSWYVFAATLAQLLQRSLPDATRVEVVARGGGIGNPILVDRGEETIAIAQAATAAWAYAGNPVAYEREHRNLRALVGGLNRVWMAAMLTEEYIGRTGNDTLKKALVAGEPLRIVMKPRGSTVPVVADMLFESLGTSRSEFVERGGKITQVSANQVASIFRDGRADLYLETAIRGHPTVTEVFHDHSRAIPRLPGGDDCDAGRSGCRAHSDAGMVSRAAGADRLGGHGYRPHHPPRHADGTGASDHRDSL